MDNWLKAFRLLSFGEKLAVLSLSFLMFISLVFFLGYGYLNLTKEVPKVGGSYTEGVIGQPAYINPLLSQTNDTDADLVRLVYSSLLKYDGNGNLINDLADRYEISDDKKTYTFHIKNNVLWHDGEKLTADDVLYTFNVLKDPAYRSPLKENWSGIDVEKNDDFTISFKLKKAYFGFLDNLTVGILPKHIWENIPAEKFALTDYNLKPIGSGPYQFSDYQKDSGGNILLYELISFEDFYDGEPYISDMSFNFYGTDNESLVVSEYNEKKIMGIGGVSSVGIGSVNLPNSTKIQEISIPRYFLVFLNQTKSIALAYDEVREALQMSVNRDEIIQKVLHGKGKNVYSPIFFDSSENTAFNIEKANEDLDNGGWKKGDDGIREKDGKKLSFKISTTDWPVLAQTADILKNQWSQLGVDVQVEIATVSDLQQNLIRPREYEALLLGQISSFNPDLYPYWHSSQKKDPYLNLAMFDNSDADKILEESREEISSEKRMDSYRKFEEIVAEKNPAVFLFSPNYLYVQNNKIKGSDISRLNAPSWRFANANKWYIKTKRVRK